MFSPATPNIAPNFRDRRLTYSRSSGSSVPPLPRLATAGTARAVIEASQSRTQHPFGSIRRRHAAAENFVGEGVDVAGSAFANAIEDEVGGSTRNEITGAAAAAGDGAGLRYSSAHPVDGGEQSGDALAAGRGRLEHGDMVLSPARIESAPIS